MITQRLGAEEGDTPVEQQPAAMRDFDPTYDRCANSTHAAEAIRLFMSAMPPIATQSVRRNEASRCAKGDIRLALLELPRCPVPLDKVARKKSLWLAYGHYTCGGNR